MCEKRGRKNKVEKKVSTVFKREIEWSGEIELPPDSSEHTTQEIELNFDD